MYRPTKRLQRTPNSVVLSRHPDKTRLIEFGRHAAANRKRRGLGKPETFDFLGYSVLQAHTERSSSWTDQSCG